MTIASLVERMLAGQAPSAAIMSAETADGRRLSGFDLGYAVSATAQALVDKFAAHKGDRIILRAGNSVDQAVVSLAAMSAGLVVVPVGPGIDAADFAWIAENCEAKGYVYDSDAPPLHVDGMDAVEFGALRNATYEVAHRLPWTIDAADVAAIIYTSGSTGQPKGVCLTHGNLTANADALTRHLGLGAHDVHLCILPLHHSNALHFSLVTTLLNDATVVIARNFPLRGCAAFVEKYGVTHISAAPQAVKLMMRDRQFHAERLPTLTTVVTASAPLPQELCAAFAAQTGVRLVQGYGLTECTNFATMTPPLLSEPDYHAAMFAQDVASVGVPVAGTEVTIAQPSVNGSGKEVGEVVIRGPQLSPGYWKGEQFHGVLHTGDLGFLQNIAGQQFLFLVGRIKEIVIRNGENYSPAKIDDDLLAHIGDLDYATVGVPDDDVGEEIALCIHAELALCTRVMAAVAQVPASRRPRLLLWLTEPIPRTPTGKVKRSRLQTEYSRFCQQPQRDGSIAEVTDLRGLTADGRRSKYAQH